MSSCKYFSFALLLTILAFTRSPLVAQTEAKASTCRPLVGGVVFWQRIRQGDDFGPMQALSKFIPLEACIEPPRNPSEVGIAEFDLLEVAGLELDFKVYWKTALSSPEVTKDHFVFQSFLSRDHASGGAPIAQCSVYLGEEMEPLFPVGACSGFDDHTQYGVSFFKHEPTR